MQFDYNYLCQGLGHLTGLETRVYKDDKLEDRYSPYTFNPDVVGPVLNEVMERMENTFYIETDNLLVFGIIKSKTDGVTIVLGPTSQIRPSKQDIVAALYALGEPYHRLEELQSYFANMVPYPFENFLEILCFVNYALNEEKLTVSHLIKKSDHLSTSQKHIQKNDDEYSETEPHNTFMAEQQMLSFVTTGNVAAIHAFFNSPPTGRIGAIAHNELRQRKNTFVCAATLISRAAITGGIDPDTSFVLSDRYLQKAELLKSGSDLTTLTMEMLLDYTQRVEALKCGGVDSGIAKSVIRYIQKNIGRKITIKEIAKSLKLNHTYLCERFKLDTECTIGDMITRLKMEEAKRMLKTSDLTIAHISDYLAFSSQSYFQTVFKKYEGCTPKGYRAGGKNISK